MIGIMQNYKTFNSFYLVEPNKSVTHIHTHTHTFCPSKSLYKGGSGVRELFVFLGICKVFSTRFADAFCVIRKSINYELL